jgi:type II secretory pathway pseudopilin PulG
MRAMRSYRFTLIEILAAIAIIVVLVGLVLGVASAASRSAAEARTKARLEQMVLALQECYQDRGFHPQQATPGSLNFATGTFVHSQTGRPYLEGYTGGTYLDAWNEPFQYQADATVAAGYLLWSKGRDKATTTAADQLDDICSWKQR